MPRLLWKDGITSLTDLTTSQKVGVVFTIVVMSLQDEGNIFLIICLKTKACSWYETVLSNNAMLLDVVKKILEKDDERSFLEALDAIRRILSQILSLQPRTEGQG